MAKFKVSKIQPIEYDFTGVPKAGKAGEMCDGKGIVPEPDPEQVDAFIKRVMQVAEDADGDDGISISDQRIAFIEALEGLEIPKEHVEDLPFRVLTQFLIYVQNELFSEGNGSV